MPGVAGQLQSSLGTARAEKLRGLVEGRAGERRLVHLTSERELLGLVHEREILLLVEVVAVDGAQVSECADGGVYGARLVHQLEKSRKLATKLALGLNGFDDLGNDVVPEHGQVMRRLRRDRDYHYLKSIHVSRSKKKRFIIMATAINLKDLLWTMYFLLNSLNLSSINSGTSFDRQYITQS